MWPPRPLDRCPKVMFSSGAGYKISTQGGSRLCSCQETDFSLFLVVRAKTACVVPETALSSCSGPFSRNVHYVETTQSSLSRPKPLKPRHRDEGVAVLTPLTHFLALLPEFGITPKLKTPGEPLDEESRVVEDLVRSCQGYIGKP